MISTKRRGFPLFTWRMPPNFESIGDTVFEENPIDDNATNGSKFHHPFRNNNFPEWLPLPGHGNSSLTANPALKANCIDFLDF